MILLGFSVFEWMAQNSCCHLIAIKGNIAAGRSTKREQE